MSKMKVVDWLKALVPAVLIASLYRIPIDFISSILWLAAFVFLVYVAATLLKSFVQRFLLRSLDKIKLSKIIGSFLCFLAFFFAKEAVFLSKVSANEKAITLAVEMQKYVLENGACKLAGREWKHNANYLNNYSTMLYGEYGTKYFISYKCAPNDRKFVYNVRLDRDSDFRIQHFEKGYLEVTYGHFSNTTKVQITDKTDLKKVARMEMALQ